MKRLFVLAPAPLAIVSALLPGTVMAQQSTPADTPAKAIATPAPLPTAETPSSVIPMGQPTPAQRVAATPPPAADAGATYGPVDVEAEAQVPGAPGGKPPGVSKTLYDAVELATSSYPSIASSRSGERAARADIRAAKNQRLPSLALQGVAVGAGRGDLGSTVVLDQPIYSFGRIGAAIDQAKAERGARRAQVAETVLDVSLNLAQAYYEIARLTRRQEILNDGVKEQDLLVESMQRRVDQNVSPLSDLQLARSRAAQARQQLATEKATLAANLMRFYQYVGDEGFATGNVPGYDPVLHHPDPANAFEQASACSPRRKRLVAEAAAARAQAKATKAAILPQLSAELTYNQIIGARAGLAVTAQTGGGLSGLAAADAAKLRASAAQLDISTGDRELREQINGDLIENAAAKEQIAASSSASQSATQVAESFKRQFVTGRRTWLDVMNAVRESNNAELAEVDAEVSAMASATRILLRTCRWEPQGALTDDLP